MSLTFSWWALALIVAMTAPLWVRALIDRKNRQDRERTARLVDNLANRSRPHDDSR